MSLCRRTALVALLAFAFTGVGCGGSRDDGAAGWVGRMRAAQTEAQIAAALQTPVPEGIAAEDRRVVRQDLHARLAELQIARGDHAAAERTATRGLNEGTARDVFRASLLIARGRAREALGEDREAADDYYEALRIDEELLNRIMGGGQ